MLNKKGISFLQEHCRPLAVDSMETAGKVIAEALEKRRKAAEQGNTVIDIDTFARHLAWIIGFDTLIDDRNAIHQVVDKLEGATK